MRVTDAICEYVERAVEKRMPLPDSGLCVIKEVVQDCGQSIILTVVIIDHNIEEQRKQVEAAREKAVCKILTCLECGGNWVDLDAMLADL